MPIQQYSQPQFNPYGDDAPTGAPGAWAAPFHPTPIDAIVSLPGSKSLTNRELVLAALADGPSLLRAPMHARDSALMIEALRNLGVQIELVPGDSPFGPDLRVTPPEELIGSTSIDCGLAGNVMRFTPLLAALALGPTTFDGDEYARKRPMSGTIAALRALGVDIAADSASALPFTVHGTGVVAGGAITIDASSSSQFISGVLMAAPRFTHGVDLRHSGDRLPSMPHIEMTLDCLSKRGVKVSTPAQAVWRVEPGPISGGQLTIEPDLSNAGPFLAAVMVAGGELTIADWPDSTTQVGDEFDGILQQMGAKITRSERGLTISGTGEIHGIDIDLSIGGELTPVIAALAAIADSPTVIRGVAHLRGHETDRLAALAAEINRIGGIARETPDGLEIDPSGNLHGAVWQTYEDHRMATAGAIIGLRVPGIQIEDISVTSKTMPDFAQMWHDMLKNEGNA